MFHNGENLSNVKRNLDAATEFANANIIHTGKSAVQKTVSQINIIDHTEKAGNADKRINLRTLINAGNLDLVIVVDLAGSVF